MWLSHLILLDQGRLVGSGIAVNATSFIPFGGTRCDASADCRRRLRAAPIGRSGANVDTLAQRGELRQTLAERRRALSPQQRIVAAQGVRRSLEQLPAYLTAARIAGYWASNGELPLNLAIAPLAARGQQFLLPLIGEGHVLRFAPWHAGEQVRPNRHGIPEPIAQADALAPFQLTVVLVPLLGFDRHGQRLGYGGGYYDRSFAFLREQLRPTEPLLVGIAYDFQELDIVPKQPWDVALDYIATDRALISCHA